MQPYFCERTITQGPENTPGHSWMLWTENTIWSKCKWATWPYERTATDNVCVHLFPYLWVCDALLELSIPDLAHPRQVQVALGQGPGLHTAAHCRCCRYCRYYELMRVAGYREWFVMMEIVYIHHHEKHSLLSTCFYRRWRLRAVLVTHSKRLWDSYFWSSQTNWASCHYPR